MLPSMHMSGSGSGQWTLTIGANTANINLKTALEALYGSMTGAVAAVVTVSSGVRVYSTSRVNPAMATGTSWPSGSSLKIVNNGMIRGRGANGENADGSTAAPDLVGGTALDLGINVTIDNTSSGIIFGGGGGGGAGGLGIKPGGANDAGGGGGGEGDNDSAGGVPSGGAAQSGSGGNATAPGAGGAGDTDGGGGGRGGYWGEHGVAGSFGSGSGYGDPPNPGVGGAGGYAVKKNGKTITWIAGNNATQVKGAVA